MEDKTFVCTCCKKKFIIPVNRWAPDRGADFFSCDWNEKDMLKHKLCGKCSDYVREYLHSLQNDNIGIIKINFCHDYDKKWRSCKSGKAITAIDQYGHLCFLKECGNIENCKYKNTLSHIPTTPVYRLYPFSGEFMTIGDHSQRFTYDEPKMICKYCRFWKWKMETRRGMLGVCSNRKIKTLIDCDFDDGAIRCVINTISDFGCKLGERRKDLTRPYPDKYYIHPGNFSIF